MTADADPGLSPDSSHTADLVLTRILTWAEKEDAVRVVAVTSTRARAEGPPDELSDYEILPDDVLVTTMGTIGRAASAPPDVGRAIFDSHLFRMRVDTSRVFPPYLCYALNSNLVASQLARMARGAIMQGLNTTILRECLIPLPKMCEQRRIAEQLDQVERLRAVHREALRQADHLFASLLHRAFRG